MCSVVMTKTNPVRVGLTPRSTYLPFENAYLLNPKTFILTYDNLSSSSLFKILCKIALNFFYFAIGYLWMLGDINKQHHLLNYLVW